MSKNKKIIAKVRENSASKQQLITVPKSARLEVGDYVELKKV